MHCFSQATEYKVTKQVFFDISHGSEDLGRITVGLFGEIAPKTVKNFMQLATVGIRGKSYVGTTFHRVIPRFMIQGTDGFVRVLFKLTLNCLHNFTQKGDNEKRNCE